MRDKQSQQRRGRADGPIGTVAERSAVEENLALASETAKESPRWPPVDREPPCAGRDSLDSAEWGPLAGLAGEISASFDLLAAVAGLGGAGHLGASLARGSGRSGRTPAVTIERIALGPERSCRGNSRCGVGKTKRGKRTTRIVVSDS